jgi:curved DNA-binding protein CbpA
MKTNYFNTCKTIDEAKNTFRKLSFQLHPDHNKSETAHKDFIDMKNQYDQFKPSEGRERNETDKADILYNTVKRFERINNVLISFVGSFIWLEDEEGSEGATKAQKEEIKKIIIEGYNPPRFASKRKKWFYSPLGYKQKFNSKKTFEELKNTWGSKTFQPNKHQKHTQIAS